MKNHDEACAVPIKREAFRDPSKQGALLQSNDNDGNPNFTALDQQLYACVRGEAAQFGVGAHMYSREPAHIEARALEATAVAASIRAEIRRLVAAGASISRSQLIHMCVARWDSRPGGYDERVALGQFVPMLLELEPACLEARGAVGGTPLMVAAMSLPGAHHAVSLRPGSERVMALLDAGASLTAVDENGRTAYGCFRAGRQAALDDAMIMDADLLTARGGDPTVLDQIEELLKPPSPTQQDILANDDWRGGGGGGGGAGGGGGGGGAGGFHVDPSLEGSEFYEDELRRQGEEDEMHHQGDGGGGYDNSDY
jgi:hypothetical protein